MHELLKTVLGWDATVMAAGNGSEKVTLVMSFPVVLLIVNVRVEILPGAILLGENSFVKVCACAACGIAATRPQKKTRLKNRIATEWPVFSGLKMEHSN
ncbi:MAG: hypothetical protein AAFZ04_02230 [Pseudomonadota bacterium]